MNFNYLPQKKDNNSEFVDNKETFNNRLFERNRLNTEINSAHNIMPKYMSENYNINRKKAHSIFNRRIIPEISKKPIVDFVNFRDNSINQLSNDKKKSNLHQIRRETDLRGNFSDNQTFFRDSILNNLSKNPYTNNPKNSNIPTKIDFSKSNLSFFIDQNK